MNNRGRIALFQVCLLIFGFVGVVFFMGNASSEVPLIRTLPYPILNKKKITSIRSTSSPVVPPTKSSNSKTPTLIPATAPGEVSKAIDPNSYHVFEKEDTRYLVTGKIEAGEEIQMRSLDDGSFYKTTLDENQIAKLSEATSFEQTYGTRAVTLGNQQYSMAKVLSDPTLKSQLASDSTALKSAGLSKIEEIDGKTILTGTDKSTVTLNGENEIVSSSAAPGEGSSELSKFFNLEGGTGLDSLATGVQWAFVAYGIGQMLGGVFGMNSDNTNALSYSFAAGAFAYESISTYSSGSSVAEGSMLAKDGAIGENAGWIGIGVAAAVFVAMYKEEKTKVAEFSCMPWQAPNGGNDCQVCNEDGLPCSEYRCKSLGQSCEIVNEGTAEEMCVYVNPKDVSPPIIRPNYDFLTSGYSYQNVKTSPPGPGFDIVNKNSRDGCIKAFTPLEFGISTGDNEDGEPAQCRIDFNHTDSYDDMISYFGGDNLYSYNHSEILNLPGAADLVGAGFTLENGKDMTLYVRCKDKNGNTNEAEYAVNFCVDPTPDATAPVIEATSIENGGCVAENTDEADVLFYLNEPSTCKWSFQDQDYDLMENDMKCSSSYTQINAMQLFGCEAGLTGIARDGVDYYIRCKDQPGEDEGDRNEMAESFEFSLRGSNGLLIRTLKPNTTIFGGVSPAPVELYAETLFGCNEGRAICKWSSDGTNFIDFFDTDNDDGISTQRLDVVDGEHTYYVKCIDEGGNVAQNSTTFDVDIDTTAPEVARVYEESGMIKIVTVRDSDCSYSLDSCDFAYTEGVDMPNAGTNTHVAEWSEENTYYIKCRDEFLNEGPDCSVIVRPTSNFL